MGKRGSLWRGRKINHRKQEEAEEEEQGTSDLIRKMRKGGFSGKGEEGKYKRKRQMSQKKV